MPMVERSGDSDRGWDQLYDHARNRLIRALHDVDSSMTLRFKSDKEPRLLQFSVEDRSGGRIGRPEEIGTAEVLSQRRYSLRKLLSRVIEDGFR